jgi:hypothetical protein
MGLLKTGLKAAVAVKTADVIHERILARQQEQWAVHGQPGQPSQPGPSPAQATAQPAAPAPMPAVVPAASGMEDRLAQLKQLGELHTSGVLTDAEFEVQKGRILTS